MQRATDHVPQEWQLALAHEREQLRARHVVMAEELATSLICLIQDCNDPRRDIPLIDEAIANVNSDRPPPSHRLVLEALIKLVQPASDNHNTASCM